MQHLNNGVLVSVLVGSYMDEKYITDCLNSIKEQTYPMIELIIANDCSEDDTYSVTKKWVGQNGHRFVRCEAYRNEINFGISKNYNGLVKRSRGEYVKLLAADDFLMPDAIEKLVTFLQTHADNEIVYSNCVIIGEQERYPLKHIDDLQTYYGKVPKSGINLTRDLLYRDFIAMPGVMFRKSTFDIYGLFREDLAFEDWEYFLRLTCKGAFIGYIDERTVAYRIYFGSNSHTGKGRSEERRFVENMLTEEKIMNEYSGYEPDFSMENYWNGKLTTCIHNDYKEALKIVLNKEYKVSMRNKMKLLAYKLHIYRLIYAIVHRAKHEDSLI